MSLYEQWAKGYGCIIHQAATQTKIRTLLQTRRLAVDENNFLQLLLAADRITNAAMWLIVHQAYARRVDFTGHPLKAEDFKTTPQGHVGGSLNMVPAYVGYLLANALSGKTAAWIMGQGHCVAAIDSVNVLMDNMLPEHAQRYPFTEAGLSRFCTDFYSYKLNAQGEPDSPLGSHVNIHTAGGCLEGGYLGFAELQYVHMPLPDEHLVAFLSDGAFEEQRGSDWAAHWWRAEDTGIVTPIMIFNGRRIDQRAMSSQEEGLTNFVQHLKNYHFDPIIFDGTDPAAFAWMILESQALIQKQTQTLLNKQGQYPQRLPYGIAVAKKGAGFYGAGTNAAHNLPLGNNPHLDPLAREHFKQSAEKLFVNPDEIQAAQKILKNHALSHRPLERNHALATRQVEIKNYPELPFLELTPFNISPMAGIDETFIAYVLNNPHLRPRVGNPDEILSNHLQNTLKTLKHRVSEIEMPEAEAIDGKIITALNEEAVICACLGNKAGINLAVTYEAFAPKMWGAIRQEINWSDNLLAAGKTPGWISVPIILTSHAYENGKNERSHQDPSLCETLLNCPSDVSRVMFPADYNSAVLALDACYRTHGRIFTLVIPKNDMPLLLDANHAQQLIQDGLTQMKWQENNQQANIILTAIGAYQLQQALLAANYLQTQGIIARINYIIEPGRLRHPRTQREQGFLLDNKIIEQYYPNTILPRIFITHTHPEIMQGLLRRLDTGAKTRFLGFIEQGGTLDTEGMLALNQQSWKQIAQTAQQLICN